MILVKKEDIVEIEYYYYVYSAMTQSMGALIALVGVFIIFRIQIQRGRLKEIYAGLEYASFPMKTRKEIDEGAKEKLKQKEHLISQGPSNKQSVQLCEDLEYQKDILKYTIEQGKYTIIMTSVTFLFYIYILNANNLLFNSILQVPMFVVGLLLSFAVVVKITKYIVNIVKVEEKEFLGWVTLR